MTEHVHKWTLDLSGPNFSHDEIHAICKDCPDGYPHNGNKRYTLLEHDEVQHLLNATERLSAEDARRLMDLSRSEYEGTTIGGRMLAAADAAEAYADALDRG